MANNPQDKPISPPNANLQQDIELSENPMSRGGDNAPAQPNPNIGQEVINAPKTVPKAK